ncbi:MAG: hypothetical protein HOQ28_03980 [Thermoleophilia bacterium]|nr:hypothetical protein [Thermoleophilia bacterium]
MLVRADGVATTTARREAARARLGRLGERATESLPALAVDLKGRAAELLPGRAANDAIWQAVGLQLRTEVGHPELN